MKKGIKLRYRILILTVIFLAALYGFSKNYLVVRSFELVTETTKMSEATLPAVSMRVDGEEINRLLGYTSNLDWELNRETITPLSKDRTMTVCIDENLTTVRRLKYELFDVSSGALLETATLSALTSEQQEDGSKTIKTAKLKLNTETKSGVEYGMKFTLVTSKSKRIYFYTRIKQYDNGQLDKKLSYVRWFRESALTKQNQEAIEKNLETKSNADTSSFAKVTIHSPWSMVSWGDLTPQIVFELPPTVTDFYDGTSSVVLNYLVKMDVGSGEEFFTVREAFRFLYTDIRTYLYNYERQTEAIFDVSHTSLSKNQQKLGITENTDMEVLSTKKAEFTAFVRNQALFCYDKKKNEMIHVFSFRKENTKEPTLLELYETHDIKLLSLRENGDIDFLVYGYMHRGEYEGRVGMVLYRYYHNAGRLEEQLYIPMNTTYQLLQSEMSDFAYMSSTDILYFSLYHTIFSYNLTTKSLHRLAEDVWKEKLAFFDEKKLLVYQSSSDMTRIMLLQLETGYIDEISAPFGEQIKLLGRMDDHIVYGFVKSLDILENIDGTMMVPMYRLVIADETQEVKKEYQKEGIYVTEVELYDSVLFLERVEKNRNGFLSYQRIERDAIQNRSKKTTSGNLISERVTALSKTEYYLSFPGEIAMKELPKEHTVPFTVLLRDPTVRINPSPSMAEHYLTTSYGRVVLDSFDAVDAIELANKDENVGAVLNGMGAVVWERGVKAKKSSIEKTKLSMPRDLSGGEEQEQKKTNSKALQNAMSIIAAYRGFEIAPNLFDFSSGTVVTYLSQFLKVHALDLRGASLDEVLYYVYKQSPVLAIYGQNQVALLIGYDQTFVEWLNPLDGSYQKMDKEKAEKLFSEDGNMFYSYME